jgi:hypothetical protein
VSDRAPKCAIVRGVVTESSEAYELSKVVETALARALVLAAEGAVGRGDADRGRAGAARERSDESGATGAPKALFQGVKEAMCTPPTAINQRPASCRPS